MNEAVEILKAEIESIHGCNCTFLSYNRLLLGHGEIDLFDGDIFLFQLLDHPLTDTAYAWLVADDRDPLPFVALKYGPVIDSTTAVQAAISLGAW